MLLHLLVAAICLDPQPPAKPAAPPGAPPLKHPHPVITEVLYAVPVGEKGDASRDGKRDATADEFVEVHNPHDKPIDLGGYSLQDRSKGRAGALNFTFPKLTLAPGETAVVFNGNGATWAGPVGDERKVPPARDPGFGGGWVFTMRTTSNRTALANAGDAVMLIAPDRKVLQIVRWGKFEETLPECDLVEEAPAVTKCSITRRGIDGPFVAHDADAALPFSPGVFGKAPPPPPEKPVTEPAPRNPASDKPTPAPQKGKKPGSQTPPSTPTPIEPPK